MSDLSKPPTHFGDYTTTIRCGDKSYIGVGHTPDESRRMAIEAANLGTGTLVFSFLPERIYLETECNERSIYNS